MTNEEVKEEYISEDTTDYELNNKLMVSKTNTKLGNKKDNSYIFIIIGVLVSSVIIAIILIILKKKRKKSKSKASSMKND